MNLWTALLLGLVGSLHCAGMCGPLALALPWRGDAAGFVLSRLSYNLGRLVAYCMLGLIFGLAGRTLWLAGLQRWASVTIGLLLLAGLMTSRTPGLSNWLGRLLGLLKMPMARLLRSPSLLSLGVLGILNGFLPCGLVYVAGAAAATTVGAAEGALYMAVFGLGTVPMLLAISISGRLFPAALRLRLRRVIPISVAVLALLLILRGMSLGISYVSPDLSAQGPSCCRK
jgi:uncharacterized protein